MTSTLLAIVALGAVGSLHCAVMCGPLLVAGANTAGTSSIRASFAYFLGRFSTHVFFGALFGSLGARAAHAVSASWAERALLVAVAAFALFKGFALILSRTSRREVELWVPLRRLTRRGLGIGARISSLLPRRALPLGLVTGLLPCGLLAAAWALAASTGSPVKGALAMAAFSLVTAPGLIASLLVSKPLSRSIQSPMLRGALWCGLALLLGVRLVMIPVAGGCH